jgi:hypothetical protein
MDGFQLDLGQMDVLIANLTQAAENISRANDKLRNATPQLLGSHELDRAGQAFQARWEYGTEKIAESVENMVGALQATRREYQRIDEETSRLFPSGDSGTSGSAGTGPAANPGSTGSDSTDSDSTDSDSAISAALNG